MFRTRDCREGISLRKGLKWMYTVGSPCMQRDLIFKSLFKHKMSLKHENENCNSIEAISLQRLLQDAPRPTLKRIITQPCLFSQTADNESYDWQCSHLVMTPMIVFSWNRLRKWLVSQLELTTQTQWVIVFVKTRHVHIKKRAKVEQRPSNDATVVIRKWVIRVTNNRGCCQQWGFVVVVTSTILQNKNPALLPVLLI